MKFFDSLSGLVNRITGTGTYNDKIVHSTWYFERPADQQLSDLYRSTWVARKMVDIPIDDMLREGWTWQADKEDLTALEAEEERLGLRAKLRQALTRDGIYGGGALIIGDGAIDPSQELNPDSIKKGGIKYLLVTGRNELIVKELESDPSANYRMPKMYSLQLLTGRELNIHPSRVIPLIGMPIEAPLGVMDEQDFWGDSRLASVMRDIAAAMSGVAGTGRLMDELAVTYHKIAGLSERLAEKGGEDAVVRVLNLMSRMKSSINSVAVDAEDDVDVITASFAGVPEAVRSLMQNVAGAADIPLTRFLGSSPDGMNATGASDIRNYYDRLAGRRAAYIESAMAQLDELLIRSAIGRYDDSIWRVWHPLWQLNDTEQVELDFRKVETIGKITESGTVHDHVVSEVLKSIMIDSPTFPGAEKAFDEAATMPEPDPVEVESANSLQAGTGRPPAPPLLRLAGGTSVGDAAIRDMTPTPLYVSRDVLNAREILEWAKGQGIPDLMPASELHVTVLYSKTPVDWFKMGTSWQDKVEVGAGGPRTLEVFGSDSLVLRFASDDLRWRHEGMIENGATSDYPEYSPHITISYGAADLDLDAIEPYQGRIVLGPEIFQKINENWKSESLGDKMTPKTQPRHPAGSSKGGQFAPSKMGGGGSATPPALAALHSVATKKYGPNEIAMLTQKAPGELSHYEKKVVAKYHKALKEQQVGVGGASAKKSQPVAPAKPAVDPTLEAAKAIATSKYPAESIIALSQKSPGELSQYEKKVVAKYNKQLKAEQKPDAAKVVPAKVAPAPSGVANPKSVTHQELSQAAASMSKSEREGEHLIGTVDKTANHQKGISTTHGSPVSDIEELALLGYSESDYESINEDLRSGKSLADAGGKYIEAPGGAVNIQAAISRHTLNDDATFVRGIRPNGAAAMFPNGIKEGAIALDPGFVSVTRDVEIAASFAGRNNGGAGYFVVVAAKRGQKVMPIREFSGIPNEDEFLLPAGSAMKVTRFDASTLTVYVDLLD